MGHGVVLVDHVFLNHLFNFLLGINVVGIGVQKSNASLLLLLLGIKLVLVSLSNHFLNLVHIIGSKNLSKVRIADAYLTFEVLVVIPHLLDAFGFSLDLLVLLPVKNLVKHLLEGQLWLSIDVLLD